MMALAFPFHPSVPGSTLSRQPGEIGWFRFVIFHLSKPVCLHGKGYTIKLPASRSAENWRTARARSVYGSSRRGKMFQSDRRRLLDGNEACTSECLPTEPGRPRHTETARTRGLCEAAGTNEEQPTLACSGLVEIFKLLVVCGRFGQRSFTGGGSAVCDRKRGLHRQISVPVGIGRRSSLYIRCE